MKLKKILSDGDEGPPVNRDRVKQALYHLRFAKKNLYYYIQNKPTPDEDVEAFLEEGEGPALDHHEVVKVIAALDDMILVLNTKSDDVVFTDDEIEKQNVYVRK
jgi:hypothetical protein